MAALIDQVAAPFRREPASLAPARPQQILPTLWRKAWRGGVAGAVGTGAMTLAMEVYYALLPHYERQPLEPSQIVRQLAERQAGDRVSALGEVIEGSELRHGLVTLASHFGYGALGGAGYACTMHGARLPTLVRGVAYGVGLFAAGYLGWLPALDVLEPATRFPAARHAGLLAVHLVYGCVTAAAADVLERAARE